MSRLTVLEHFLVAVARRIREVDAVIVVGIHIDEPSVQMCAQTDASHSEWSSALSHVKNVSLVGINLSTLREHIVGCYIVDVLCLADSSQGLEVEP